MAKATILRNQPLPARFLLLGAVLLAWSPSARATTDDELAGRLVARFARDRTGVCVVAAVIEDQHVARAATCAKPRPDGAPGFDTVFEIGSVTKTMTAFLVADLIEQGKWSLDDPIARHLPSSVRLPRQGRRQILVRDIVTHRSGLPTLPPGFTPADDGNPFARLTEQQLLTSLRQVRLTRPIGSQFEYSNYAMMVLSLAVARAYGTDFETALRSRLLEPLGMKGAFVTKAAPGVAVATGHTEDGHVTPPWTIATNLAGVGLVHAHLNDMVKYVQAQSVAAQTPLAKRMQRTHVELAPLVPAVANHAGIGMNWGRATWQGKLVLSHEGSTGGFVSFVALIPEEKRGVVVMADTDLENVGGLADTGLALLGLDTPLGTPRVPTPIPATIRQAIVGTFDLAGQNTRIWDERGRLMVKVAKEPAFELSYDSHGDLYSAVEGMRLTPALLEGRIDRFAWHQDEAVVQGVRKKR